MADCGNCHDFTGTRQKPAGEPEHPEGESTVSVTYSCCDHCEDCGFSHTSPCAKGCNDDVEIVHHIHDPKGDEAAHA